MKASAPGLANHCARSSVSAHTTATPSITYGASRSSEGWNVARYVASASISAAGAKWYANENGIPSTPAACALYVLDPSSQMAGR